jgi:cytochrome c556
MIRNLLVVAGALMLGVTAVAAQSCEDVITNRQNLMKASGAAGKTASEMIRGTTRFDLAKAQEILATFANDANHMPAMFPDCSKSGDHTTAGPAIWDKPDDFKAMVQRFTADVKAGQQNTKDLDTFKASIQNIGKDCSNCHQNFRVRPS